VTYELLAYFSLPTLEAKVMDFGIRGGFPAGGCAVSASNFPARPRCPLFRFGLPTLQVRFIDFEFGGGSPAPPRYPLFRFGLPTLQVKFWTLNLAGDLPHGIIFPLLLATHSSGEISRL
jgi:hypothetical protein